MIDAINVVIVVAVMDASLQRSGTTSRVALSGFLLASEAKKECGELSGELGAGNECFH